MRNPYPTRTIRLSGPLQLQTAQAMLANAPVDPERPLELILREEKKARGLDANALMWAGPLRDIAEQAWVDGRQYPAEVWHEYLKRLYLPEDTDAEYERMVKDGYRKWAILPFNGDAILIGSTTQLTKYGFAVYLQQIEAYGASLGVLFHARAA